MKKLKVLHMTTHLNVGGITTYILLLARAMDRNQCEIAVLSSGGNVTSKFQELGMRTHELSIKTKSELSPKIYCAIPKIVELIRKEGFDLIHAHTRITQVMAWLIQKLTGIPFVTTCHGFYKKRLGRRLLSAWGDQVIAISVPVEDDLVTNFHVPRNRVSTIFNAIDIEDLENRANKQNKSAISKEWNLEAHSPIFGIVARIVADKGHEYLVRAFLSLLQKRCPNAKLLIVGEGPYKQKVVDLVHQLGLDAAVTFVGNLSDVTKALVMIDVFVLPAIWREGFGLSIVEAMALKKPVIVTNIWALNALVHHKQNGLLIPPKNVGELANAMNELVENKSLADHVGKNGYETVKKEFSIDRMVSEMTNLYQKVVQNRLVSVSDSIQLTSI